MRSASALIVVALSWGCQSASTQTPSEGQTVAPGRAQSESMSLRLDAPAQAPIGKPVQLKLTLRNTSKDPVQVTLAGRPPSDFIVTTPDGAPVWRWSEGHIIQMILEMKPLKPGEQLEYEAEWNPASPGRYLVTGIINMDPPEKMETKPKELVLTSR